MVGNKDSDEQGTPVNGDFAACVGYWATCCHPGFYPAKRRWMGVATDPGITVGKPFLNRQLTLDVAPTPCCSWMTLGGGVVPGCSFGKEGVKGVEGAEGSSSRGGVALGAFVSCFLGSSRKESPSHSAVLGVMSWVPAPIHPFPLSPSHPLLPSLSSQL